MKINIFDYATDFAEDKDIAAEIRKSKIELALKKGDEVELDFTDVTLTTQSFIHALISDVLRTGGEKVLDDIVFKSCASGVRGIIETVVQYSLETMDESDGVETMEHKEPL